MFHCKICNTIEYGNRSSHHNRNAVVLSERPHIVGLGSLQIPLVGQQDLEIELESYMDQEGVIYLEGMTAGQLARIMYLITELSTKE